MRAAPRVVRSGGMVGKGRLDGPGRTTGGTERRYGRQRSTRRSGRRNGGDESDGDRAPVEIPTTRSKWSRTGRSKSFSSPVSRAALNPSAVPRQHLAGAWEPG